MADDHDPKFNDWESEKRYKVNRIGQLQAEINEVIPRLAQAGFTMDLASARYQMMVKLLLDAGLLTEKQILDMEYDFALGVHQQCLEALQAARAEAARSRLFVPPHARG